jgi:crossover junction endodeoxyribonuclease RuvC
VRVAGVDPGNTGDVAILTFVGEAVVDLKIIDIPVLRVKGRGVIDTYALAREIDAEIKEGGIDVAILEQGGVRPQNGRVGAATFWLGVGVLHGIFAANFVPLELVSPAQWKRVLRVPADKDGARQRASAIFPRWASQWSRVKDHGRAEASLIALYGVSLLPARRFARGSHDIRGDGIMAGLDDTSGRATRP